VTADGQKPNPMRNVVEGVALPYGCDRSALPEPLGQRFVELACDQATVSFVRQAHLQANADGIHCLPLGGIDCGLVVAGPPEGLEELDNR